MKQIKRKPSVLQVLPALISGGVERGTAEIASYLVKNNYNSFVASSGGPMISSIYHEGSRHFSLPLASKNPYIMYQNIKALINIIYSSDIDIIHARSRAPAWSAYFAAKATGKKFVTTFHGIYHINNYMKRKYNSIMAKGDVVIGVSNFSLNYIKENYQIDENKIRLIRRGVDLNFFDPDNVSIERIINIVKKFYIPVDRPIILLPARFTRWKGHKYLLDVLRLLDTSEYYCLIVGDDNGHELYRRELEHIIFSYNLKNNVALISHIVDMPALYLLADVVISASIEPEAFGRIVTEAQCMGRYVIATNIGGAAETVINNSTGWLVDLNDVEAFANKIRYVLAINPEIRKKNSTFLRNYVKKNFSLELMCSKTLDIYNQLLNI